MIYQIAAGLVVIGACVGYFYFTQNKIEDLTIKNGILNTALVDVKAEQERLLDDLEEATILNAVLAKDNQEAEAELNRYISIFRRHDLNKLAEAKPGLLENRVNNGTKKIFEELENETKVKINTATD